MSDLEESAAKTRLIDFLTVKLLNCGIGTINRTEYAARHIISELEALGMQVEPLEYNAREPTDEHLARHGIQKTSLAEPEHVPAIVPDRRKTGGVSAEELNTCGICGAVIAPDGPKGAWIAITPEMEDRIRRRA